MRHHVTQRLEDRATPSASTTLAIRASDVRRLPTDELIAELADLEAMIQLLSSEVDELPHPTKQDLVEAEYTILTELRRRQQRTRHGLSRFTFRHHSATSA